MTLKMIKQDPKRFLVHVLGRILRGSVFADACYLRVLYKIRMKKTLNLSNPQTYNEKLQWLKLYDRRPEYAKMVDKYEVKDFVSEQIGKNHIIPTLGIWERFDDIDFDTLPDRFVLKCTHDSGGLYKCSNKDILNKAAAKKKIEHCLRRNYYINTREWPYKNIKPRILAEEYMVDESGYELKDYKFFCFNGVAHLMFIATDRGSDTHFDFFDMDFHHLPIMNGHANSKKEIHKPRGFEQMKMLAAILSQGLPHVRVDFYDINGNVYFGEMTFFHWSGLVPFDPEEWDYKLGELIHLPLR